ncbi:MAG: hypothetical protein H7833_07850 [Magnetococcus sp. DMHC-1]
MRDNTLSVRQPAPNVPHVWLGVFALFFSVSCAQIYPFSGNQNTYFVHAMILANWGELSRDWLASTLSSIPYFDHLLAWAFQFMGVGSFYALYILLMALSAFCLGGIVLYVFPLHHHPLRLLIWFVAVQFVFSSVFAKAMMVIFKTALPQHLFISGEAWQIVFTSSLEPATFGLGLVMAIYLFLINRYYLAVFAAILSCTLHTGILLATVWLLGAFFWILWRDGWGWQRLGRLSLFSGLLSLPVLIYVLLYFSPTSAEISKRARQIIAFEFLPYHADSHMWLGWDTLFRFCLVICAIFLVARQRVLRSILLIPLLLAVVGTVVQYLTRDSFLGLLFPWRISSVLVPMATVLILAWILVRLPEPPPLSHPAGKAGMAVLFLLAFFLSGSGIYRTISSYDQGEHSDESGAMKHMRDHWDKESVYLVPIDMLRARLYSGMPVYVDGKGHPFRDQDFLQWWERVHRVRAFYAGLTANSCFSAQEVSKAFGVSHVIVPVATGLVCPGQVESYRDSHYVIYKIKT